MNEVLFRPPNSSKYSSESIRRKTVGLTVRQDLLALAREHGLNLSKLLKFSLIQTFEAQTKPLSFSEGFLSVERKSSWCGHRDLNPGRRLGKPMS